MEGNTLMTRRKKARFGTRKEICGIPVAEVKSGKTVDYITAEEFAEAIYGKAVKQIVFVDDSKSKGLSV